MHLDLAAVVGASLAFEDDLGADGALGELGHRLFEIGAKLQHRTHTEYHRVLRRLHTRCRVAAVRVGVACGNTTNQPATYAITEPLLLHEGVDRLLARGVCQLGVLDEPRAPHYGQLALAHEIIELHKRDTRLSSVNIKLDALSQRHATAAAR